MKILEDNPTVLMAALTAILVFVILLRIAAFHPEKLILRQYEEFTCFMRERQRNSNWYRRTEEKLKRNGAEFHYGKWINPIRYLVLRILLALAGIFSLSGLPTMGYAVLTALLMYFLPEWLLVYLNRQDNVRMLPEIKLVYQALEIQIKAGVYVTDALAECYGSVREKRLQQALLDLAGNLVMRSDLYEALEGFQRKFDNRYIDALCITILQAWESGQAVELLQDIGEQLKDMETAVLNSKKNSLDRSVTFYQLGILTAVLAVIIYACVSYMFSSVFVL